MTDNTKQQQLRFELEMLRARHDHGAVSPAVHAVIKQLESQISWSEHHRKSAQGQS